MEDCFNSTSVFQYFLILFFQTSSILL